MSLRTDTRVVTDDRSLYADLQRALQACSEGDVSACGWSEWSSQTTSSGAWPVSFVDLREECQWARLEELVQDNGKDNIHVPSLIGLIDVGIPLNWTSATQRLLDATVSWPCDRRLLSQVLHEVAARQTTTDRSNGHHEPRILHGKTCSFTTYTPQLRAVLDDLEVAARHDFSILLVGETGTGKTTLAKLIHELSPRAAERFLTVPCGALPNELIDSELFGHVKGAFTGADRTKEGKFDAADGGTLLLDEIDVLGLAQQAKLLRVLETGEFEPVGSNDTRHVSARTIVASNIELDTLVDQHRFRMDLYYRLNQVSFEITPLRRRRQDIVPLAVEFIEQCCRENALSVCSIRPEFLDAICAYFWPGNIRQLRNEVRRAVLFARDGVLSAEHLSPEIRHSADAADGDAAYSRPTIMQSTSRLAGQVAEKEQLAIEQMLRVQNYNRTATARALGISRVTLYNKIRKYGIRVDVQRRPTGS